MRRVAIGPFTGEGGDDWPVYDADSLQAQGWEVVPLWADDVALDATIIWSPEYAYPHGFKRRAECGLLVACLGDWHINVPPLDDYDLIATDWRGLQRCRDAGVPDDKLLWFRMFSFDPRLHVHPGDEPREIDIAFMGRPDGGPRDALLDRIARWAQDTDRTYRITRSPFERGHEAIVYQDSKIVVNWAQRGELNMRAYEAVACGALSVLQHDAVEVFRANAPIPTYDPAHVESFLEAWLADDEQREAMSARQRAWVQRERPVDHLAYLLKKIGARLDESGNRVDRVAGSSAGHRLGDRGPGDAGVGAGHHPVGGDSPRLRESEGLADEDRQGDDVFPVQPADLAALRPVAAESVGVEDTAGCGGAGRGMAGLGSARQGLSDPTLDEQRAELCALVPASAQRVLDLGCGRGGVGWRLTQDRIDKADLGLFTVYGVDASPKALAVARERLHGAFAFDLNYPGEAWQEQSWYQPGTYDCVILADILEHLVDPWHALELVKPLLAPDGVVVASVPNLANGANVYALAAMGDFNYHLHGRDKWRGPADNVLSWGHLRFFTRTTLYEAFDKAGYTITHAGKIVTNLPERVMQWLPKFAETLDEEQRKRWEFEVDAIQYLVVARPS